MLATAYKLRRYFPLLCLTLVTIPCLAQNNGERLYTDKCASCHAADGSGKTSAAKRFPIPDLRSKAMIEMSDGAMFNSIGRGTQHKNYPHSFLYTGMKETDVRNLVQYVRVLQKKAN